MIFGNINILQNIPNSVSLPSNSSEMNVYACMTVQACTSKMNLGEEVDLEDYVGRPDKINNAEIAAICQEAGMQAVRKNRCPPPFLSPCLPDS